MPYHDLVEVVPNGDCDDSPGLGGSNKRSNKEAVFFLFFFELNHFQDLGLSSKEVFKYLFSNSGGWGIFHLANNY